MKDLEAQKNKRIREIILTILQKDYPNPVDTVVLRYAIDNLGYPLLQNEFEAHLKYLDEKGYVKTEKKESFGMNMFLVELTANGWDLLDGLSKDKGIGENNL